MRKRAAVLAFVALLLAGNVRAESVADLLRSKNVEERLRGVKAALESDDPGVEALLQRALDDPDWEVVHRAIDALAVRGKRGGKTTERLVELMLQSPVRRIRLAAAAALGKIDRDAAVARLLDELGPRDRYFAAAVDALTVLPAPEAAKPLARLLKQREPEPRRAALLALAALREPAHVEVVAERLADEDVTVRAAAAHALSRTRAAAAVAPLLAGLRREPMTDVMERRHVAAIREILLLLEPAAAEATAAAVVAAAAEESRPAPAARLARLLAALGRKGATAGPVPRYVAVLTDKLVNHRDETVRSAAVSALGRIGAHEARAAVERLAHADPSARVRFHALRAALAIGGSEASPVIRRALAEDASPEVREEAAALASRHGLQDAAGALLEALSHKDWRVAVAASVALGRLRHAAAVAPLGELYGRSRDWRVRGGAVVGLGWVRQRDAVDVLLDAMEDPDPSVRRTAIEFLRHVRGRVVDSSPKEWRAWWTKAKPNYEFADRDEAAKAAKRYGYAVEDRDVYKDLDVVVLQTRGGGDEIQTMLTKLEIQHRLTRQAALAEAGLHPLALFVANCPGEIVAKDAERVEWFVRAGGYLFASCWALTHTVLRSFPDADVAKLDTRQQVIDSVLAEPLPTEGPFLEGVFDGVTMPLYELEGSHLIALRDPERFEVLIDSPQCAQRWGEGNLAGWLTLGHGVILDSANHFEQQGMKDKQLRTEAERMAYAVNHLGYDYAELRKLVGQEIFKSQGSAAEGTRDLSMFRFITTFVRQKRLADTR